MRDLEKNTLLAYAEDFERWKWFLFYIFHMKSPLVYILYKQKHENQDINAHIHHTTNADDWYVIRHTITWRYHFFVSFYQAIVWKTRVILIQLWLELIFDHQLCHEHPTRCFRVKKILSGKYVAAMQMQTFQYIITAMKSENKKNIRQRTPKFEEISNKI